MNNVYMGIDPGYKGFISILKQENESKTFEFFSIAGVYFMKPEKNYSFFDKSL